ncbi:MAG: 30S ribosomal protein S4 [Alphaproteobacteria bacterium]|nr:30S ribosomal protein S4 [Alphaproteobacteria bacterium]
MARFRGPRLKRCRAVGTVLPGLTSVATLDRPYPPGVHGANRRNKPSDYKVRLQEKQKARWHFGVLEKQFQAYVRRASRMKGSTGLNLVLLLESRLDNLVWRLGLARTIPGARQLVVHGHVQVDGHRVDRPSFHVSAGQVIAIREKSKNKPFVQELVAEATTRVRPTWLEFDPAKLEGKLITAPDRQDLPFELNENAIVEYYSQKL